MILFGISTTNYILDLYLETSVNMVIFLEGVFEDSKSRITNETLSKIKDELAARIRRLCKSRLNAKNLIKAINEHAISLVNYYVGLLKLEPEDYRDIDSEIRKILSEEQVHLQPACMERLYLPREELGRGLHCVEHRSEQMLLQLHNTLDASKEISTRRAAILKVEYDCKTHLSVIVPYLKTKYGMKDILTKKNLEEAQTAALYGDISKKIRHEKLYRARNNEIVNMKDSSMWLKRGNIRPQDEARYCYLQDRNMFGGSNAMCPHCNTQRKTVEHLATQCEKMLYHDYMRRHNEVLRCIHLLLCNKYGVKSTKRMGSHSVQEIVANENVEIRVDTRIRTSIKLAADRPDIFILDKRRREIVLIEVGITSQDRLQTVETEKTRKYDLLANKLGLEYKCKTRIIPYVMTWDGVVTKHHRRYVKEIGLTEVIEAYIQTIVLKKTLESISFEHRRAADDGDCPVENLHQVNRPRRHEVTAVKVQE